MIAPLMNKLQKNPAIGSQSDIIQSVTSNKSLKMVSDEDALSVKTVGVGHQDGKRNTFNTKYMWVEKCLVQSSDLGAILF